MENKFKYIVYQTINIKNNKIYIGVHRTKDPAIFDEYIGCGVRINSPATYMNPKTPFQYAVKKYGPSSFRRSVLYVFDNEDDAYNKEADIVNVDFIKRSDTYNMVLGGCNQHRNGLPIYQFSRDGILLKKWDSIHDIEDVLEYNKRCIYAAINRKSRLYGCYWSFDEKINLKDYSNPNNSRKVYKYDKYGKCVAIYESIGQAAKIENVQPCHIIGRVKNGSFSRDGFYFSYKLYDTYISRPRLDLKNKNIYLYDLNGNFIEEVSMKDFKKRCNPHVSYKRISNIILNKETLIGYQIRIEKFDKIDAYKSKNKKKAVIVYDLCGNVVREFDSVTAACRELKLDTSTVSRILRGTLRSTKGYTIKYKIEDIV